MARNVRITVGGIGYSISSDEDEAYIKELATDLERDMNVISQKSPFLSATMVAVMAALQSKDTANKIKAENDELRLQIKRLLEESAKAKMNADIAERKLSELGYTEEDEEF